MSDFSNVANLVKLHHNNKWVTFKTKLHLKNQKFLFAFKTFFLETKIFLSYQISSLMWEIWNLAYQVSSLMWEIWNLGFDG